MSEKEFEPGLISSGIRFACVKHTGMIQNNSGGWVSVQNYCNLSRQLDRAVQRTVDLTTELESLRLRVETAEARLTQAEESRKNNAALLDDVYPRLRTAEKEAAEAYAKGQRDMQERVAKRLDDLAVEQKSWHNHCAASVIRMEANAIRTLPIKERP